MYIYIKDNKPVAFSESKLVWINAEETEWDINRFNELIEEVNNAEDKE